MADEFTLIEMGVLLLARLSAAHEKGESRDYLESLSDDDAALLWQCVVGQGWWEVSGCSCDQQRLIGWFFLEGIDFYPEVDGQRVKRLETPEDRLSRAIEGLCTLQQHLKIPTKSCLGVYRRLHSLFSEDYLIGNASRVRSQPGSPFQLDDDVEQVYFDDRVIGDSINRASRLMGLSDTYVSGMKWIQANQHHPFVKRAKAHERIRDAIAACRATWKAEIFARNELPKGWELEAPSIPSPITDVDGLRRWLSEWLDGIHGARTPSNSWSLEPEGFLCHVKRELRNSRRAMRDWGISRPEWFDDNPESIEDAERQLELLIDELDIKPIQRKAESPSDSQLSTSTADSAIISLSTLLEQCADALEQFAWIEGSECPFSSPESLCFNETASLSFHKCVVSVNHLNRWFGEQGTRHSDAGLSQEMAAVRRLVDGLLRVFRGSSCEVAGEKKVDGVVKSVTYRWNAPTDSNGQFCPWVEMGQISELRVLAACVGQAPQVARQEHTTNITATPTDKDGYRVTQVAQMLDINKGLIGRMVTSGELTDNGLTGRVRRITAKSLMDYCMKHGIDFTGT
jgi:hypothetical protein